MTSRRALAAAGLALLLTGCEARSGPEFVQDPESELWYLPGVISQDVSAIHEAFPMLEHVDGVILTEGQITDPGSRIPIPAPDDYWMQVVVDLGPEDEYALLRANTESLNPGEDQTDAEVRRQLVPTVEEGLEPCDRWVDVMEPVSSKGPGITATGRRMDLAVLCRETGQFVSSMHAT